jgi:O-antigen/teichoic acid export membrane protein
VLAVTLVYRRIARPQPSVDTGFWWPFMRAAAPIGLAGVFGIVLFRVDAAILASFRSDAEVGQYGAAFRLFESTLFLSWSVGTAIYPVLSRLTPSTEPPLASVFDRGLKLVLAVTMPLAATAAVLGGPLVDLVYGSDFGDSRDALVLLAPAIALYPLAHLAGVLLYARDLQLRMAVVYGVAAVVNVALNVLLIAGYGLQGAAVAASLTWLVLAASLLTLAIRASGAFETRRVVGGPLAAAIAAAVTMGGLRGNVVLALSAGAAVYVAVLVAWEQRLYPDDARALGDFLLRRR